MESSSNKAFTSRFYGPETHLPIVFSPLIRDETDTCLLESVSHIIIVQCALVRIRADNG